MALFLNAEAKEFVPDKRIQSNNNENNDNNSDDNTPTNQDTQSMNFISNKFNNFSMFNQIPMNTDMNMNMNYSNSMHNYNYNYYNMLPQNIPPLPIPPTIISPYDTIKNNNYNKTGNNNMSSHIQKQQYSNTKKTGPNAPMNDTKSEGNRLIFRKQTLHALCNLFPSLATALSIKSIHCILVNNKWDIKHSIHHILENKDYKGKFDKHICLYHLARSCQYESTPHKCRYNHNRNVPSGICRFWLINQCKKGNRCLFNHKIPTMDDELITKQEINRYFNGTHTKSANNKDNNELHDIIVMLTVMFPNVKQQQLKQLLGLFSFADFLSCVYIRKILYILCLCIYIYIHFHYYYYYEFR